MITNTVAVFCKPTFQTGFEDDSRLAGADLFVIFLQYLPNTRMTILAIKMLSTGFWSTRRFQILWI